MGKYTKIKADGGPIKKVRISDKGAIKDVPINTPEYKQYYNSKTLAKATEDPNLLTAAQDISPAEATAKKPTWLTFKEEAIKNYPEARFRNEYFLPALKPSDLDSLPQNALDEYNKRINNTVAQRLLKERTIDKNWEPKRKVEAFTQSERDIILNSDYGEDLARNVRLYDSELANKESFSDSSDKADLLRRKSQATGDKLSLQNIPGIGPYIPNILDVTGGIGSMTSNFGAVPDNINKGNYASAILGVAAPMGAGYLAGIGAPTTAQFVNNVLNPLAGTGSLIKGVVPASVKTITKAKNLREAVGTFAGIPTERSLPRLSEQDFKAYKAIQELGRRRDLNRPIADQYEYALLHLPEEHIKRIYGKSKDELASLLKTTKESADDFGESAINYQRNGRGGIDITQGSIDLRRPVTNEIRRRYNIPPSDLINTPNYGPVINELDPSLMPHLVDNARNNNSLPIYDDITRVIEGTKNRANAAINNQATKLRQNVGDYISEYPTHRGAVKQNVPGLFLRGNTKKGVHQMVADMATHGVESGDVFAGSLNTSHSSYLPQLRKTFEYTGGDKVFLNYKPMNRNGYLSQAGYTPDEIARYLNTAIDTDISRGRLPSNIQRPFLDEGNIYLPHYGVKQYQYGGYINNDMNRKKYADGGPIKGKKKPTIKVNDLNDPKYLDYKKAVEDYNKVSKGRQINSELLGSSTDLIDFNENFRANTTTYYNKGNNDNFVPVPRIVRRKTLPNGDIIGFDRVYDYVLPTKVEYRPKVETIPLTAKTNTNTVQGRNIPTPQSPVNPLPYDDIQLYSGHQNRDNAGKPVGYVMEDGKRRDIMADEYNAIMGSSVQGGTKLENTNYAMGGRLKKKYPDGGYINTLEGDLISKVLMNRNRDKDFVQRAYAVGDYPNSNMFTSPDPDNFGSRMSHKMSWGEDDKGQAYMYPSVMNPKNEDIKIPRQYADYISSVGYKKATGMPYAMGGRLNQAQQLNAGKMRMGNSQGNSFGDYAGDIGKIMLNNIVSPIEGLTGAEIYNPDYSTEGLEKVGNFYGKMQTQAGKMLPQALNMIAPGVGTAVGAAGKTVGNVINSTGQQEMEQMGQAMKMAQGGLMHINEGGTHEQNALGGVPIGPNALVEQGETINNDFVFSDRLKPKGSKKTYAQLSKSVDTKYRLRPDDKLSKEAKQMDLDRLAMQQEAQKDEMSTKYMQKAMACGGKIKGFGGSFQGPISQSMNVTNGQNTLLAMGGNLPNYDYGDDGNIRRSPYNNIVNGVDNGINNVNYQPSNDVIFNERMKREGFNPTLEDYNKVVLGQQQAAMGGLMSNFMEPTPQYYNPADLDNQYAHGGSIHIKPENRGKFTASANRAGMGVQEFASHVLANKEDYSSTQVKRANFARNFGGKKAMGGNMYANGGGPIGPLMQDGQFATGYPTTQGVQGINPYITPQYPIQNIEGVDPLLNNYNFDNDDSWEEGMIEMGKTGYPMAGWTSYTSPKDLSDYTFRLHPSYNDYKDFGLGNMPKNGDPIKTSEDMTTPIKTNRYIDPYNQRALNEMAQRKNPFDTPSTMLSPITNPNRITQFSPTPTEQDLANYSKQMQGTNTPGTQNPYGEVGNTGYLTNLAGNLIKAGMVATSKPPIYNPSLKLNRMNANPAERLAMQEGRREIQGTKDIIRNNATSSGQYLTNASLMGSNAANKLAGTIGGIRQQYDTQNVGIGNQEAQLNQAITSGNNLAKETFRDNRLNQYNKILDSVIGANQQRFATDVHANNFQNQVISLLKTGVYHYGKVDEKGLYEILGPNNEVITKMPKVS